MIPITKAEVATAVTGAFRLFMRDPNGIKYFGNDGVSLLKSFWAAAIVLPAWFILDYLTGTGVWLDIPLAYGLLMELAGYSMVWTVWPLLMLYVAGWFSLDDRYNIYIIAQNWMAIPSVLLYLVAVGGSIIMGQPDGMVQITTFVAAIWTLYYHYFVIKTCLQISGLFAVALMLLEFLVGLGLLKIRLSILLGV